MGGNGGNSNPDVNIRPFGLDFVSGITILRLVTTVGCGQRIQHDEITTTHPIITTGGHDYLWLKEKKTLEPAFTDA